MTLKSIRGLYLKTFLRNPYGAILPADDSPAAPTSSSYAWLPITIPDTAQYLSLDFTFNGLSPADYLSVGVNDTPLFQLESEFVSDGVTTNTGYMDISQWAGQDVQLFLGLVASDDNNAGGTITIDDISFENVPEPRTALLLPASIFMAAWSRRVRRIAFAS